jgi:methyl-accepting chemotaxis protein
MTFLKNKTNKDNGTFLARVSGQRLATKLAGVAGLSLLPVIGLGALLIADRLQDIRFTRQELLGVEHADDTWRALSQFALVETQDTTLDAEQKNKPAAFNVFVTKYMGRPSTVGAAETADDFAAAIQRGDASMMASGIAHLRSVANGSNLILDPDLDTIYLVLNNTFELPKALASLQQQTNLLKKLTNSSSKTIEWTTLNVALADTLRGIDAVQLNAESTLRALPDAETAKPLQDAIAQLTNSTAEMAAIMSRSGSSSLDHLTDKAVQKELLAANADMVSAANALWNTSKDVLLQRLSKRLDDNQRALFTVAAIFGVLLILCLIGIYSTVRSIRRPIALLIDRMSDVREGRTHFETPYLAFRNEVGDIARAVEASRVNATELGNARKEIDVRLDEESSRNAGTRTFLSDISRVVEAARQGQLHERLSLDGRTGFLFDLSKSLNGLLDNVATGIDGTSVIIKALAAGDVSTRMTGESKGIFLDLMNDVNTLSETLRQIAGQIGTSSDAVQVSANDIAAGVSDLSVRTEQQASSLEETAASMEEMAATVRQNSDNAQEANQLAAAARQLAVDGGHIAEEANVAMDRIEASSRQVTDIVSLIQEIAFQTNILALNAAVEAARAGEAGRGFAVVANEVRALAQRSAQASKDVKDLIAGTTENVAQGTTLVKNAGRALGDVVYSVRKVADIVSEIAAACREQSMGIDQISRAISDMDQMTQENAALVERTNNALLTAQRPVEKLRDSVAFFQVEATAPNATQKLRKLSNSMRDAAEGTDVKSPRALPRVQVF